MILESVPSHLVEQLSAGVESLVWGACLSLIDLASAQRPLHPQAPAFT